MRSNKHKKIEEILTYLPHFSYSHSHQPLEPITLLVLGSRRQLLKKFRSVGWYLAERFGLISAIKSAVAALFNSSYPAGPIWPAYVEGKRNQLGFEMPTRSNTFRRRHHLRLWKSKYIISGTRLWVGTLSYDRSAGLIKNSLIPAHHINSTLTAEEEFLASTFKLAAPVYVRLGKAEEGIIATGDPYTWNGRALVLDLSSKEVK